MLFEAIQPSPTSRIGPIFDFHGQGNQCLDLKGLHYGTLSAGQRCGGDFGGRLGRQGDVHAVDEQSQVALRLGVAGQYDLAPVVSLGNISIASKFSEHSKKHFLGVH